ncbi:hypothetical protein FACS1894132_07960 [Clostridia bacterium]|nr:hypothetical protein FACS1894132_07960 [Clostridia bacterium]
MEKLIYCSNGIEIIDRDGNLYIIFDYGQSASYWAECPIEKSEYQLILDDSNNISKIIRDSKKRNTPVRCDLPRSLFYCDFNNSGITVIQEYDNYFIQEKTGPPDYKITFEEAVLVKKNPEKAREILDLAKTTEPIQKRW